MKAFLSKYKYQVILIFAGIVWISLLNEILQVRNQNYIYSDSDNYRESASFFYHELKAHYYRPLVMAAISGIPYLFGDHDASIYRFSFFINLISWLGTALLLLAFLRKHLTDKKALVFTLIFYTIFGSAFLVFHLLTESLFTFLIMLAFFFFDKYYTRRSFYYLSVAISILLVCILIKPGAKFLAVAIMLFFCRALLANAFHRSALLIYLAVGCIIFQCFLMKKEYGNFTISYIDGVTFYNYIGSKADCLKNNNEFNQSTNPRASYIFSLPYSKQKDIAAEDAAGQLKENKINLVKAYISDLADNSKSASDCIAVCKNIKATGYFEPVKSMMLFISKWQNRFFTAIGIILALYCCLLSWKHPGIYTLMSFYILYIFAVSGISCQQGDRFHVVFFPAVIVLAGKFYAEKIKRITSDIQ